MVAEPTLVQRGSVECAPARAIPSLPGSKLCRCGVCTVLMRSGHWQLLTCGSVLEVHGASVTQSTACARCTPVLPASPAFPASTNSLALPGVAAGAARVIARKSQPRANHLPELLARTASPLHALRAARTNCGGVWASNGDVGRCKSTSEHRSSQGVSHMHLACWAELASGKMACVRLCERARAIESASTGCLRTSVMGRMGKAPKTGQQPATQNLAG